MTDMSPLHDLTIPEPTVPAHKPSLKQRGETASLLTLAQEYHNLTEKQEEVSQGYLELKKLNEEQIEALGTDAAEEEISHAREIDRLALRMKVLEKEVYDVSDLGKAALQYEAYKVQEEKETAYIESAMEYLTETSMTDPSMAGIAAFNYEGDVEGSGRDAFGKIEDFNKKVAILKKEIDRATVDQENTGLGDTVVNYLSMVVPLNWTTSMLGNVEDVDYESSLFNPTGRQIEEGEWLLSSKVSPEELIEKLPELRRSIEEGSAFVGKNEVLMQEAWRSFLTTGEDIGVEGKTYNLQNILHVLDTPNVPGIAAATKNIVKQTVQGGFNAYASASGNRMIRNELGAADVEAGVGASAAHDVLPTSARIHGVGHIEDYASAGVINTLKENQVRREAAQKIVDEQLGYLSPEELADMVDDVATNGWDGRVLDIKNATARGVADIDIGTKTGAVFRNKEWAENTIENNGMLDATVMKADDIYGEGYFIRVHKTKLDDTGVIRAVDPSSAGRASTLKKFLLSPDLYTPTRWIESIKSSQFARQALAHQVLKPMLKTLQKTNKETRETVNTLFEYGQKKELDHYLNVEEMNVALGRRPTDSEILAYYTTRDIADISYDMSNTAYRDELHHMGWRTLDLPEGQALGRQVTEPKGPVHDYYTHKVVTEPKAGSTIIELKEHITLKGVKVKNVLLEKSSKHQLKPLPQRVLNYSPGFRTYEGKFFVKQANTTALGREGLAILNDKTHNVNVTKEAAEEFADKWNLVLKEYDNYKNNTFSDIWSEEDSLHYLRELLDDDTISFTRIKKLMDDGEMTEHPFEVVYDQGITKKMEDLKANGGRDKKFVGHWYDEETTQANWYMTSGRSIYSKRSPHLRTAKSSPGTPEYAETIDVFDEVGKRLDIALRNGTMATYRLEAIESWYAAAKGKLTTKHTNAVDAFKNGQFNKNVGSTDKTVVNQLETLRESVRRNLEVRTREGEYLDSLKESLQHWVDGSSLPNKVKKPMNWILEKDPVKAIRSVAFDTKLGFFDPSQLLIQTQTMFAALSLSPVHGAKAMYQAPALRLAYLSAAKDMDKFVANKLKGLHGVEKEEFVDMVKSLKESGLMDIGGELALEGQTGVSSTGKVLGAAKDMRETSRMFFYESERWNRLVAYGIAWREAKQLKPDLDLRSFEGIKHLRKRADDYSMNMTGASKAWWQDGVTSLATQFYAYPARMLETMTAFGSKKFTPAQRTRLMVGQALMYGTAGVPLADYLIDNSSGKPESEEVRLWLETGGWDRLIFSPLLGVNTNFADRVGVAEALEDMYEKVIEDPSISLIFGAGGAIGGDIVGSIVDVFKYYRAESIGVEDIIPEAMNEVLQNINTFKRSQKALFVFNHNMINDGRGNLILDVPKAAAMGQLLGISLKDTEDMFDMIKKMETQKETERDILKQIKKTRARIHTSDDPAERRMLTHKAAAYQKWLGDPLAMRRVQMRAAKDSVWVKDIKEKTRTRYIRMFGNMGEGE